MYFYMNKRARGCFQCVVPLLNNLTQRKPLCYLGKDTFGHHLWSLYGCYTVIFISQCQSCRVICKRWVWTAALFSPDSSAHCLMLGHHGCERATLVVLFWLWTRIVFLSPAFTLPVWLTQGIPKSWTYLCVNKRKTDTDTPLCLLRGSTSLLLTFSLEIILCQFYTKGLGFVGCILETILLLISYYFPIASIIFTILKLFYFSILNLFLKDSLHCFWNRVEHKQI